MLGGMTGGTVAHGSSAPSASSTASIRRRVRSRSWRAEALSGGFTSCHGVMPIDESARQVDAILLAVEECPSVVRASRWPWPGSRRALDSERHGRGSGQAWNRLWRLTGDAALPRGATGEGNAADRDRAVTCRRAGRHERLPERRLTRFPACSPSPASSLRAALARPPGRRLRLGPAPELTPSLPRAAGDPPVTMTRAVPHTDVKNASASRAVAHRHRVLPRAVEQA